VTEPNGRRDLVVVMLAAAAIGLAVGFVIWWALR
jgi:hypothetical protein